MLTQVNMGGVSETINFLRFPLIVLVVFIHAYLGEPIVNSTLADGNGTLYLGVTKAISLIIARVAVPLFFFISGYLFFYKQQGFTFQLYKSKIKKRVKTLFIPYLAWNIIGIILIFTSQLLMPDFLADKKSLLTYRWYEYILLFYDTTLIDVNEIGHFPVCNQLWFIRDLMIVTLFSPIIYYCVKRLKLVFILALGVCWFTDLWPMITGFSSVSFLFFSFGAFFSIMKLGFVEIFRRKAFRFVPILYVLLVGMLIAIDKSTPAYYEVYQKFGIITGIISAIILVSFLFERNSIKTNDFLSKSSFFVYAFHSMPLVVITKCAFKLLGPSTEMELLILYFLCPIITILVGLLIYRLMVKHLSGIASVLTGNR